MKISILTISLNQAEFLPEALTSILSQDHSNIEVLVADPGSTDGSRELLTTLATQDKRLRCIFRPDSGPSDGLNKALFESTGDIVACLNADDYYLPDALRTVDHIFRQDPTADIIIGNGFRMETDGTLTPVVSDKYTLRRYAYGRSLVLQQATFFRGKTIRNLGLQFNTDNRTCWDTEFLLDAVARGACCRRVDHPFGVFRIHHKSITGSGVLRKQYRSDRRRLASKALGRSLYPFDSFVATVLSKTQAASRLRAEMRLRNLEVHPR